MAASELPAFPTKSELRGDIRDGADGVGRLAHEIVVGDQFLKVGVCQGA